MRALLIALLTVFHVAGVAWSGETVVSGDSDHEYLPQWSEREVLLHEFTWKPNTTPSPGTHTFWPSSGATWNSLCMMMFDYQPDARSLPEVCSSARAAYRAPRMFTLTRVVIRTYQAGSWSAASNTWAQSEIRVVSVATDGTITEIGAAQDHVSGSATRMTWDLNRSIGVGEGVGIQMRAILNLAVDDIGADETIQLWGIWK